MKFLFSRYRRTAWPLCLLAFGLCLSSALWAQEPVHAPADPDAAISQSPEAPAHGAAVEAHTGIADERHEAEHGSLLPTIAKAVNFAALLGVLVYFLRTPIAQYLAGRRETVRADLVTAKTLRTSAEEQLRQVRERLTELPAEIEALRARGTDDLANERVRLTEATAREREKVLETTRRDIERQSRLARRELTQFTADLAMSIARRRIETAITPADQQRLIERYAKEVQP